MSFIRRPFIELARCDAVVRGLDFLLVQEDNGIDLLCWQRRNPTTELDTVPRWQRRQCSAGTSMALCAAIWKIR